jgi:hypothetical protein
MIYTIKTITDHARAAAAKVAAGDQLTAEDTTFISNVLMDYANRLDTRSEATINKQKKSTEPHLAGNAAYVLSRRVEKDYKALLGLPAEPKRKAGRKKKKKTAEPKQPELWTA